MQADRILLQRAITNLLTNAIRHASANSTVRIELSRQAATVRLSVENVGASIPAKNLGRVFDRFYRVDKSRARHAGGAGLGLAIVKTIMRLHGGHVEAVSKLLREDQGVTRFMLIFPDQMAPATRAGEN